MWPEKEEKEGSAEHRPQSGTGETLPPAEQPESV